MKTCTQCHRELEISSFPIQWRAAGIPKGRNARCYDCLNENRRKHRADNKDKYKEYEKLTPEQRRIKHLNYKYRMTIEEYEKLLKSQNGKCQLCGIECTSGKRLSIDHDHQCCTNNGRTCGNCTRGLLCNRCNLALGNFGDDIELMRKAIAYVESYRNKR